MSVPPYGQQPGGWPQQPGPGQPPGYGQQPGGYPPPQQGYGPPQPQYGGYPAPPPKKSKAPLIILLVALLLIGGGVGAYFLFSGPDTSSPEGTAKAYATAATAGDTEGVKKLVCAAQLAAYNQMQTMLSGIPRPPGATTSSSSSEIKQTVTYQSIVSSTSSTATARIHRAYTNVPPEMASFLQGKDEDLPLVKEGGEWKVCQPVAAIPSIPNFPSIPAFPTR